MTDNTIGMSQPLPAAGVIRNVTYTSADLRRAAKFFDVKAGELNAFDVEDPFNPGNRLAGFVCRRSDSRYGALYITHVNGIDHAQVVFATPKFPYPFDKNGMFKWPKDIKVVRAYEKLDGTNVFGYCYRDWQGKVYVTFKTRLLPVLGNSRFGPFLEYWKEILKVIPGIPAAVHEYCRWGGFGLSFELYGRRNKHLILYDTPLDTALLFGVRRIERLIPSGEYTELSDIRVEGWLEAPNRLIDGHFTNAGLPLPKTREVSTKAELTNLYKELQAETDALLVADEDLGAYRGAEGWVWYTWDGNRWEAFKCKPSTIEAIHWATGGLGKNIVMATAYNVLEDHDYCTPELLRGLLLEEFNEVEIDLAWQVVMRASAAVNIEYALREKALSLSRDLDFKTDPPAVMRHLSSFFDKKEMRRVYAVLSRGS